MPPFKLGAMVKLLKLTKPNCAGTFVIEGFEAEMGRLGLVTLRLVKGKAPVDWYTMLLLQMGCWAKTQPVFTKNKTNSILRACLMVVFLDLENSCLFKDRYFIA